MKNILKENLSLLISLILITLYLVIDRRNILIEVPLSSDELFSWNLAMMEWKSLFENIVGSTIQFLYYIILKLWLIVIPENNDFWIRVPSLIFGIAGLSLLFTFTFKKVSPLAASATLLFILFDSRFLEFITFNRSYSLLFFLSSLNIISLIELLKNVEKKNWRRLFLISLVMMIFTNNLTIIYISTLVVVSFILKINLVKELKSRSLTFISPVMLVYLAMVIYQYLFQVERILWIKDSEGGFNEIIPLGLLYIVSVFVLRKNFQFGVTNDGSTQAIRINTLIPVVGTMCLVAIHYVMTPVLIDRYLFIFYPSLYLLMALAVEEVWNGEYVPVFVLSLLFIFNIHKNVRITQSDSYNNRLNFKGFFLDLKQRNLISKKSKIVCIITDNYLDVLVPYSIMQFKRNICTSTSDVSSFFKFKNHDYIIYFKGRNGLNNRKLAGYNEVYEFDENFSVLK